MRTDWIPRREFEHLLAALMPENRLAMEISLATGLRIGDVLNLRTNALKARFTVRELKTGKNKRVFLNNELLSRAIAIAGKVYVFEGRNSSLRPRTRQAVYKDLKRIAKAFRLCLPKKANVAPHSARKVYAVEQYYKTGSLEKVQQLLNHKKEAVTVLYALADQMVGRRRPPKQPLS